MEWEWVNEWNSTNSLPKLVHVGLGMGKDGKSQDVAHRYVALPATAVPPDAQMAGGAPGQLNRSGVPNTGVPVIPPRGTPPRR
jgi:hypothetical protein